MYLTVTFLNLINFIIGYFITHIFIKILPYFHNRKNLQNQNQPTLNFHENQLISFQVLNLFNISKKKKKKYIEIRLLIFYQNYYNYLYYYK